MKLLKFVRQNAFLDSTGFGEWALKTGKKTLADAWVLADMPPQARLMVGFKILSDETLSRFIFALRDKLPAEYREIIECHALSGAETVVSLVVREMYQKISIEVEASLSHLPAKQFGPAVTQKLKSEYAREESRLAKILFAVAPKLTEDNAEGFVTKNKRKTAERVWR